MGTDAGHRAAAEEVRRRTMAGVDPAQTAGAMRIGAGGDAEIPSSLADVARLVGTASYRVTDAQVAAARAETGSDRGAFEIVMAAGVGAALHRWDAAIRAIEEAADAPR